MPAVPVLSLPPQTGLWQLFWGSHVVCFDFKRQGITGFKQVILLPQLSSFPVQVTGLVKSESLGLATLTRPPSSISHSVWPLWEGRTNEDV